MDCSDIERAILAQDAELTAEVAEHVAGCPSCSRFADLRRLVLASIPQVSPPSSVDRAVLDCARRRLRGGHSWRLLGFTGTHFLAVAAALALAAALTVFMLRPPGGPVTVAAVGGDFGLAPELSAWTSAVLGLELMDGQLDTALEEQCQHLFAPQPGR